MAAYVNFANSLGQPVCLLNAFLDFIFHKHKQL